MNIERQLLDLLCKYWQQRSLLHNKLGFVLVKSHAESYAVLYLYCWVTSSDNMLTGRV